MLIADELDADWSQMRAELAPAGRRLQGPGLRHADDRRLGHASPTPSPSTAKSAPAPARCWWPPPPSSGRWRRTSAAPQRRGLSARPASKATYGALADAAMKQPVPEQVTLKDAEAVPLHRQADAAPGRARQVERPPAVRHRLQAGGRQAGRRRGRPSAGVRRQGGEVRRRRRRKAMRGVIAVLEVPLDRGGTRRRRDRRRLLAGQAGAATRWRSTGTPTAWASRAATRRWRNSPSWPRQPGAVARKADAARWPAPVAKKIAARLRIPLPGARADGADQLHGRPEGRPAARCGSARSSRPATRPPPLPPPA